MKSLIYLTLFFILKITPSLAQCSWGNYLFDSFEYNTVCPDVIPSVIWGTGAPSPGPNVHSGSRGLYFNFVDTSASSQVNLPWIKCFANTVFYKRTFNLCSGVPHRISAWFTTTYAGAQCNIRIRILQGSNVISQQLFLACPYAPGWVQYVSPVFTPTAGAQVQLELRTNVGGCGGNDLGMDDLLIERCWQNPSQTSNTVTCSGQNSFNLFNQFASTTNTIGIWTGPTLLGNGFMGTFNPTSSPIGTSTYSYSYLFHNDIYCPQIINTVTVSNLTNTLNVGNTGPYCPGNLIQLQCMTPAASYTWSGPQGFNSNVQNPVIPSATSSMSGIYTLTVTSGQCTSTASTNVIVSQQIPPVSIISNGPICSGTALSLSIAPVLNFPSAVTFNWAGPNGFTSTQSNPILPNSTANMSGLYSVTVTSSGCSTHANLNISINSTPTISSVSNTGPVCQGASVTLAVNASSAGTTTFNWLGPMGYNSTSQNPVINNAIPGNSGVYTVTVTNTFPNGLSCQANGSTNLSIVPVSSLVVTPSLTLCQPANLNLVSNAIGAASYSWTGPSLFSSALQNPVITNVTTANSGNYSVTAYFTSPLTTLVCTANAVTNVSVVPTSPLIITMPNNLCQYATASISATAPGAVGYSWVGPNNFSSNQQTAVITNIQPNNTGTYYSTATFAIGTASCTITGSNQLSIIPVSSLIVTPTVSVCEGNNAFLSSSSIGAVSYSWFGPNNFAASGPNTTVFLPTPIASGIYTVSTYYTNGSVVCYNSNTVELIVGPKLTFTLDAYKQMCYNSLLNVNGPAGATSYTWTSSTGFTSNTQNLNIPGIQPNQSGTYTLNVALGNCITSQKIQIEVLTPLAYTLTPPNQKICRGDSVKLIVGSTGGSQNYAYVWTPGVFLGSPTGSVQYSHPLGTTIYNLSGYDIACPNYSVFYTFTVQVNQPPVPDLRLEKEQGCQPLCLFYNTKTRNQAATTTYDFGGTNVMQADSFTYCLTEPGNYNLKIESLGKNGCRGVYNYPLPIVVFPKPHSDFTWSPDIVTTSDNQVTFYPTHKYGSIAGINWMFSGTGINGYDTTNLKNPQRVFETPGRYPIILIQRTDKGCIDSILKYVEMSEDFNVFIPNAFTPNGDGNNDVFNIKGLGLKTTGFRMDLFDRWGHSMFFTEDITKGWDGTVNGQMVQDGIYIYKISAFCANGEGQREYVGHVKLIK